MSKISNGMNSYLEKGHSKPQLTVKATEFVPLQPTKPKENTYENKHQTRLRLQSRKYLHLKWLSLLEPHHDSLFFQNTQTSQTQYGNVLNENIYSVLWGNKMKSQFCSFNNNAFLLFQKGRFQFLMVTLWNSIPSLKLLTMELKRT